MKQRIGAILIGDELLNGRRQDTHMAALIERLSERGLELDWVRLIGDDPGLITETLTSTVATDDIVFSYGGIGATPDDRTRQCAADAFGVPVELHPEAEREIRGVFGERTTAQRLRMGEFPRGSSIIPNPINRIPGFSMGHHHFVPGFPKMAWPMVEWVLDTYYRELQAPGAMVSRTLTLEDTTEGPLITLMETLLEEYPDLRLSCLPDATGARRVEFSLRGEPDRVGAGMARFQALLNTQT